MEGNFRIVQLSDCEFIIEKEVITTIKYPWYKFKKPITNTTWRSVDERGELFYSFSLLNTFNQYKATTLEEAKEQLSKIKKYPIIITE